MVSKFYIGGDAEKNIFGGLSYLFLFFLKKKERYLLKR
jgi:hypothetical protein